MAFVQGAPSDSFDEGAFAYRGGLRNAVECAEKSAPMWADRFDSKGRRYSHVGVVIFGRDDQQPSRVICRFPVPGAPIDSLNSEELLDAYHEQQVEKAIDSAGRQIAEKEEELQRLRDELGALRTAVRKEDTATMRRYLGPFVADTLVHVGGWADDVLKAATEHRYGVEP